MFPKLKSNIILAPMAGVTDVAFRILCREYGAALTVTEMISANALARNNQATVRMIDVEKEPQPRCIQLFGQNTESIVKAAKYCQDKCEIIDFNLGCPASKIIRQGSGSALLERPNKVKEIIEALVNAVDIPITVKLRLGITKSKINIMKIAKICEDAGVSMISIHARTQKQGYAGKADWEWIKKVKDNSNIPITANGDVKSVEDYLKIKEQTGCDHVMIGRAAIGNPYIFKQIDDYNKTGKYNQRTIQQQFNDFEEYLELAAKHKIPFQHIKFHAMYFTKGINGSSKFRNTLNRINTITELKTEIKKFTSSF